MNANVILNPFLIFKHNSVYTISCCLRQRFSHSNFVAGYTHKGPKLTKWLPGSKMKLYSQNTIPNTLHFTSGCPCVICWMSQSPWQPIFYFYEEVNVVFTYLAGASSSTIKGMAPSAFDTFGAQNTTLFPYIHGILESKHSADWAHLKN